MKISEFFIACVTVTLHAVLAQQEEEIKVSVYENQVDGFFIANVAEKSGILERIPDHEKQDARFTYLNENPSTPYFVLDNISGNLTTSAITIDREFVCKFKIECLMTFDVAVQAKTFFSTITVSIDVLDVNDNSPVFPKDSINKNISEKETVGTEFRIDSASDEDTFGNNSVVTYSLEQEEGFFELVSKKEANTQANELYLRLVRALDREGSDNHVIKVIAVDGGDPVLTGVLTINVNVMDENDNAPVFDPDQYNVTIDENIGMNSNIFNLSATDIDMNENARVSYKFRERQPNIDTILETFSIEESTGQVFVIKNLIYEPMDRYDFSVEAFDHGEHPQKSFANVTVTVRDVGNNPPVIHVNLLSPGKIGFVNVSENEPVGFFIAFVNVEDTDKGQNGDFTCDVLDELFKLENFSGRSFKVVLNGKLDRETLDTHNVTVVCADKGEQSLESSASFLVRVTDVNDNDPIFVKDVYSVSILENNKLYSDITQVVATDKDIGENGLIEYVLHEDSAGAFLINNDTGFIFANKSYDRETDPYIVFRVLAVDHGKDNRTGTTTISMTVLDVNDNAPYMVPVRPELYIQENQEANISVGILVGKDDDLGENGQFSFSFASAENNYPFAISDTGKLTTTASLDRESVRRYEIPIRIFDKGTPTLSNNQYVTIFVGDENDNKPTVSFPNDENDTVQFPYPVQDYNVVTTIVAHDKDDGENASLSYSITGGNELDIFEIDERLGEISIKKLIDIQKNLIIVLTIEVSDRARVPKSTTVTLNIELMYANATAGRSTDGGDNSKYIIISVVVVLTTAVFAIAIVGVILFLRNMDRRKADSEDGAGYSDSGISSRSDADGYPMGGDSGSDIDRNKKKEKEVSFSFDFSLKGLDGGRNVESSSDEVFMQKVLYLFYNFHLTLYRPTLSFNPFGANGETVWLLQTA